MTIFFAEMQSLCKIPLPHIVNDGDWCRRLRHVDFPDYGTDCGVLSLGYRLMVTVSPSASLWLRVLPLALTLALPLTRAVRV